MRPEPRVLFALAAVGLLANVRPAVSAPSRDPTAGPIAVRVTASALNVRSAPGTSAVVRGQADQGQVYVAIARSGEWYKIWFDGQPGWVHGSYLVDDASPVAAVTASVLNVRSGPGTSYGVVGQAYSGQRLAVRGSSNGWSRVDFDGRSAWVSSSYLSGQGGGTMPSTPAPSNPTPSNPSTPISHGPASSAGYIQLPASGPGFYCYSPESRRWGTPRFIYGIERVSRRWSGERPAGASPRVGIGDISAKNGGYLSGHASHQRGVDGDFSVPRNDGQDLPRIDRFSSRYSRAGMQKLVNLFRAELNVTHIFFNDPNVSGRSHWPNHDNHYHMRIQ